MNEPARRTIDNYIKKAFWVVITTLFGYGVKEVSDISENMRDISIQVGVFSEKINNANEDSKDFRNQFSNLHSKVELNTIKLERLDTICKKKE